MSYAPNIDGAAALRSAWRVGRAAPVRRLDRRRAAHRPPEGPVMRIVSWVRWATCALTVSVVVAIPVPVAADHRRRSIADCASFEQVDSGQDKVAFTIRNACSIPVACSVSWRVVCAPDAKTRRAAHPGSAKLAIIDGASQSAEASAAICGDDAWVIDRVQWACEPDKS
jgi:hypothetical protein